MYIKSIYVCIYENNIKFYEIHMWLETLKFHWLEESIILLKMRRE